MTIRQCVSFPGGPEGVSKKATWPRCPPWKSGEPTPCIASFWGTDTLHCKFYCRTLQHGNASATHLQRTAATTTRPPEEHTALQGMTAMHLCQAQPSPNPGLALAPWAPTMARLSSRHAYRTQPPRLSHRRRSARCRRAPHARFFTQRSFTNPATCRHRLVALYSPCVCCSSWLHSQHAHSACRTTQHLWIVLDQP